MHGRPVICSITSMHAPSPHPPNSAPVPDVRPRVTSMRHFVRSFVAGSKPKNVRASIGGTLPPSGDHPASRRHRILVVHAASPESLLAQMGKPLDPSAYDWTRA